MTVTNNSLDINSAVMSELSALATEFVTGMFDDVRDLPVFPSMSSEEVRSVFDSDLPLTGEPVGQIMSDCDALMRASRQNGHPRFFGYVASPSTPIGAYADLIASTLNQNVTSWRSAPAATQIEHTVVRWLGEMVGFSNQASGWMTSGGSMANLNALLIAHRSRSREGVSRHGLWNSGAPTTIYASDQIHLSIPKAADILGIGRDNVRLIPSDQNFRLDLRLLRERIESDRSKSLKPFCVVANAGGVSTGAVDSLFEIARIARENDLWFHIDGAYGALGALSESVRDRFKGVELADSISIDAHKWLYAPVDCGCLLVRDGNAARSVFDSSEAGYIKIHEDQPEEAFAFWDSGIELSRRFRALKIWMMIRHYGAQRIAAAISKDIEMAHYLGDKIISDDDFELLAPVELSICCFRYVPPTLREALASADVQQREVLDNEIDAINQKIMHAVQRGGKAYLSNALLRGRYALRACITNFRTTADDIDETLEVVRESARSIIK